MKTVVAALSATLMASGCSFALLTGPRIEGAGPVKSTRPKVGDFKSITAGNALSIEVKQGEAASVEISAEENLLPHITAKVVDGALVLRTDASLVPHKPLVIRVVTPKLQGMDLSGAAEAKVSGFGGEKLEVETSGAASVEVDANFSALEYRGSGASRLRFIGKGLKSVAVDASGASTLDLGEFDLDSAKIELSGAAQVKSASKSRALDFDISGGSRIEWGGGERGTASASGGSSIRFAIPVPQLTKDASSASSIEP